MRSVSGSLMQLEKSLEVFLSTELLHRAGEPKLLLSAGG